MQVFKPDRTQVGNTASCNPTVVSGRCKLTLTNLKEDFFGDVTTDAALKKKIEENISNPAMYEDIGTGARVPAQP